MSNKPTEDVPNIKWNIRQKCIIYRSNFEEFKQFLDKIKEGASVNSNDVRQSEYLLSQMNNGEVRIIFCGQVKSGKSRCVMEFLSGALNLPSKDTPATTFFARIFYSEQPLLYSESSTGERRRYSFDGKSVSDDLVGKRVNYMVDEKDLDRIYHIGISEKLLENCFVVIDSPGLNETQSLDDAFKRNLKRLNPQLVLYIFNYGPGFTDCDSICYSSITSTLRNDLRKIFVFNKFDEAFNPPMIFQNPDDPEDSSNGEDYSSDDEERSNFEKLYAEQYSKHFTKLEEIHSGGTDYCLIGYSGKYTQLHRIRKKELLPEFRVKHKELVENVTANINSINMETSSKILAYVNQFLLTEFKDIFRKILDSENTNQRHIMLSGSDKDKILFQFDFSHEKLLNIAISQIPQINFDAAISQIVKNQDKIQTLPALDKFTNLISSLSKFLIDRYTNYFSNIILAKLDEISFDKLVDDLRQKEIDHLYSHTFCSLTNETENIEEVIKQYFETEVKRFLKNYRSEQIKFPTTEAYTFYIRNNFRFQKDLVWMSVNNFIAQIIDSERKHLENSIETKKNEIGTNFKVSKEGINQMIKDATFLIKKWIVLSNNYINEQCFNTSTNIKKIEFLSAIIDESSIKNLDIIELANKSNILFKCEHTRLQDLNYDNCELIKFFLRSQYNKSDIFDWNLFYREKDENLFFITDINDFKPLRSFLVHGLSDKDTNEIIQKLIVVVLKFHEKSLPVDYFGPDMVFCRRVEDRIEVKILELTSKFGEWKYTLTNGKSSSSLIHKYPHHRSQRLPCMFYSLSWTILIILNGACEEFKTPSLNPTNVDRELNKLFPSFGKKHIFKECCHVMKKCLQQPFKSDEMDDIRKIFEGIVIVLQ